MQTRLDHKSSSSENTLHVFPIPVSDSPISEIMFLTQTHLEQISISKQNTIYVFVISVSVTPISEFVFFSKLIRNTNRVLVKKINSDMQIVNPFSRLVDKLIFSSTI